MTGAPAPAPDPRLPRHATAKQRRRCFPRLSGLLVLPSTPTRLTTKKRRLFFFFASLQLGKSGKSHTHMAFVEMGAHLELSGLQYVRFVLMNGRSGGWHPHHSAIAPTSSSTALPTVTVVPKFDKTLLCWAQHTQRRLWVVFTFTCEKINNRAQTRPACVSSKDIYRVRGLRKAEHHDAYVAPSPIHPSIHHQQRAGGGWRMAANFGGGVCGGSSIRRAR